MTFAVPLAMVLALVLVLAGLGIVGVIIGLVLAAGATLAAFAASDAVVLRLGRAQPADPAEHARLHNLVEGLCVANGLPKPRLFVIDDDAPNAFVTGRNQQHAALAVTTGLLELLDRVELEGVLAHELSHIKNDDISADTLAVTTVGLITVLADVCIRAKWSNGGRRGRQDREEGSAPWLGGVGTAILAGSPLWSKLIQSGTNPRRDTWADLAGVQMTRFPPGLISALEKFDDDDTVVAASSRATAHLWIAASLARTEAEGQLAKTNRLFDTHPPLQERIATLREL